MLSLFDFGNYSVKCITDEEGNPRFKVEDVCHALELLNIHRSIKSINPKRLKSFNDDGHSVSTTFVNEGGLYGLIGQSRKPIAIKFNNRIYDEVLPSIRKYGSFSANKELQYCIENQMFFVEATYVITQKVHRVFKNSFPSLYKSKFNNVIPKELYWSGIKEIPLSNKSKYSEMYVTPFTDVLKFFGIESLQPRERKFVFDTCCIGSIYEGTVSDSVDKTLSIRL